MKREYIAKGKTIDDAIEAAALELGVDRDELSVEIIDTPFRGFLGIGSTLAKIKATVGEDDEVIETKPVQKTEKPVKKQEKKKAPKKAEPKAVPVKEEAKELTETEAQAKDFVDNLIKLMGISDYRLNVTTSGKTVKISVNGKNMGALIGKRGDTMYAIQYLASLAVNKEDGQFARIEFDVENYRAKRTAALEKLAVRMAEKVVKNKKNMTLECMQAYERRVIHATLQDFKGVSTRSVGEDPFRKVIICYEKNDK